MSGFAKATSAHVAITCPPWLAANAIAIIPPIEVPWTRTRSSFSASRSFAPSAAHPSIEYHSRGLVEAP